MTSQDETIQRSFGTRLASTCWRVACWGVRALLMIALVAAAISPTLVDRDWRFDLVASLLAQVTVAGLVLTGWQLIFRRWIWASLFLVITIGAGSWMLRVERAYWAGPQPIEEGRQTIRLLSINVHSKNDQASQILDEALQSDADVVVFVECSWELIQALSGTDLLLERYPHRAGMGTEMSGQIIVLSRYAMSSRPNATGSQGLASSWGYRAGFLDVQGTPVRFAAVHAPSPRTEATWGYGRMTFDRLAMYYERIGTPLEQEPYPTIFIGDLNSTPTGSRSLHVNEKYDLLRTKPLTAWDGTFPASLPWLARSSIDGAFVSPDVFVHRWNTTVAPGSDHRGVLIELSVPVPGS